MYWRHHHILHLYSTLLIVGGVCNWGSTGGSTAVTQSCGQLVNQSPQSQLAAASFMGKHSTFYWTLGQMVKCWMLTEMIAVCEEWCYWILKVPATVGPTLCTNFVLRGFLFHFSCTGPMELKTQVLSDWCILSFIYFFHWKDSVKKELCWKGTLSKGTLWIPPSCHICLIQ